MPHALLAIAHPDDEAYAFPGLVRRLRGRGWTIAVVCATNGEGGERHDGGEASPAALGAVRAEELARSCALQGLEGPVLLGLSDGGLEAHGADIERALRERVRGVDLLVSLGADGAYGHPDHLALYETLRTVAPGMPHVVAAFAPGLFLAQYEQCAGSGVIDPERFPRECLGSADGRWRVTLTAAERAAKLAAIACHRTQLPGGEPRALFPAGTVEALLREEWFEPAEGGDAVALAGLLGDAVEAPG